jgi:hypothetical protein
MSIANVHSPDRTLDLARLPSEAHFISIARAEGNVIRKIIR